MRTAARAARAYSDYDREERAIESWKRMFVEGHWSLEDFEAHNRF